MKMKKITSLFVLLSFNILAQTNWHVSTTGSDSSGTGSINQPFKSLQKAADMVQAGDTIFVHQGTYYNQNFNDGDIWKNDNLMTITASGNPGQYIVIMPYPGDQVVLKSDAKYNILVKNTSYIKIQGFEFEGIAADITQTMANNAWGLYKDTNGIVHDLAVELGIDINDPAIHGTTISKPVLNNIKKPTYYTGHGLACLKSHHIEFVDNIIHDFPGSGLRADKSDHVTIMNNKIYHNTYWTSAGVGALTIAASVDRPSNDTSTGIKFKVLKNYVHHNENRLISWNPTKNFIHMVIDEGSGIFFTRNAETYHYGQVLVANNITSYNGASGIVIHKTDRATVEFNTVYKNGTTNDGKPSGIGLNNINQVVIRNNISYVQPDHWALGKVGGTLNNLTVTNNIIYNENGTEPVYHNIPNSGFVITNPLLIDPDNGDFRLQAGSPAIDAGIVSNYTNDDYDSNTRDSTPDIGAYEFSTNSIDGLSEQPIRIYPNPANTFLTLRRQHSQEIKVQILDMSGKIVFSDIIPEKAQRFTINLNQIKSGVYILVTGHIKKVFIKN